MNKILNYYKVINLCNTIKYISYNNFQNNDVNFKVFVVLLIMKQNIRRDLNVQSNQSSQMSLNEGGSSKHVNKTITD